MIVVTGLLTYLLQSTLLLAAAWLVGRLLRRHVNIAETVWRVALLGSIVAPLLVVTGAIHPMGGTIAIENLGQGRPGAAERLPQGRPGQLESAQEASRRPLPAASTAAGAVEAAPAPALADAGTDAIALPALNWPAALLIVWGFTAGVFLTWHLLRRHQLFSLLERREVVTDSAVGRTFNDLCAKALLRRPVRLTTSPACPVPIALTSSEVCVPAAFLHALDDEQQRGALAHEVAHVARRDPQWLVVDAVIGSLLFFQPLNIVARRALREHAEWQCDDWAARQGAALGLARCLADVAAWLKPFPRHLLAVTVPMARRPDLVHRVERLLSDVAPKAPARRSRPLAAAGFAVIAVACAAPVFSASVPSVHRSVVAPPEPTAVTAAPEPLAARVSSAATAQVQIVRAPRGDTPLRERVEWALREARARSLRHYWVGYSFSYPLQPRQQHMSDSDGINFDGRGWPGTMLGDTLGVGLDNGIAVLVGYTGGGNAALGRVALRSMNAPMDFDGATVYWLGTATDSESVPWLDALQQQVRPLVLRSELVEAVSMHRTSTIVLPVLERILGSEPERDIRAEAAEGLEHHPVPAALRLAHATAARDTDRTVRAEAAEAIGEMPIAGAVDALVDLANTADDSSVRGEAAEALGSQPADAASRGIEQVVFHSPHADAREEAVEALGEIESATALALLRRIIWEHPDTGTRVEAVETIGDLEDVDAVAELREILERHPDSSVRDEALDVLSETHTAASYALILEVASAAPSAPVRRAAIEAVADATEKGRSTAELEQAVTLLEHAIFNDRDESVQLEAVDALQHFPRPRALAILQKVVDSHPSRKVRREALEVIADIARR